MATQKAQAASHQIDVIDGLNCAVFNRAQIERTLQGGVAAMNLTALRPANDLAASMSDIAKVLAVIAANGDIARVVTSVADIHAARKANALGVIIGTQNSTFLEHDLQLLRVMARVGVRILQPTYMEQNALGSGVLAEIAGGLTERGREWVALMNELRLLIDLSHVGYATAHDVIKTSKRPIIFSHSNARALCDSLRNIPDELIRAAGKTGGTVGVTLWPPMLKHERRPTIDDFCDHVDHLVNLIGVEHVAFGSDLSEAAKTEAEWAVTFGPRGMYPTVTGVLGPWFTFGQRFTVGFESMATTGNIVDGLARRGYGGDAIEKIMSGNLLRVYGEVWGG